MDKMIKESPVLASIMESIRRSQNNTGRTQASQLTANGAKFVIRNPALLRILAPFRKAPNQVGFSPLLLRSAYSANYSEVQALENRIAELINENQRLKGQYDQQKGHDKALYDELQAKHNNLNNQLNNLTNQNFNLNNQVGNLTNQNANLTNQNANLTNQNGFLVGQNANLNNYRNTLQNGKANALHHINLMINYLNTYNSYAGIPGVAVGISRANLHGVINTLNNTVLPLINQI